MSQNNWFLKKLPINVKFNLIIILCLILALSIRVWSLGFGLPYRYHIDEPAYVLAALQIGQGHLHISYPDLSPSLQEIFYLFLYGIMFLFDFITGRVSSPTDFSRLYKVDPSPFYLLSRGFSVICSLGAIVILYQLVRRTHNNKVAVISCFFLGVNFLDVRQAHFSEPYSLISLIVIATTFLSVYYYQSGKTRLLVFASILCGVAVGQRITALPIGLTLLLGLLLRNWPNRSLKFIIKNLLALVPFIIIGYIVGAPGILLNTINFFHGLFGQAFLASTTTGFWGYQFTNLPTWKFYSYMIEIAFGMPLTLFIILGIVFIIKHHSPEGFILLSFPFFYILELNVASGQSSAFARYLVPAFPFMAIFAAIGVTRFSELFIQRFKPKFVEFFLILLVVFLSVFPLYQTILLDRLWSKIDTRTIAKEWVEFNIPNSSKIATQWYGPPLASFTDSEPYSERVYDVTVLDPFTNDPNLYTIGYYVRNHDEYLILSSFIYDLQRVNQSENAMREEFYSSLNQKAQLIAEFKPYSGKIEPPFFFEQMWGPITDLQSFDRPGPTIKIYRISDAIAN
jgi:hypothetical protein